MSDSLVKKCGPAPRPVETAPRDGRLLRLLVDYSGEDAFNSLTDELQAWTVGCNALDNTGEDEWQMAGWNWTHDCFSDGNGKVIGWLPFHPEAEDVTA